MSEKYSWETSFPAYKSNEANSKERQCDRVLNIVKSGVADNMLKISEIMGIPQSTVGARCSDLLEEGKIVYVGTVQYKNFKRKKIVAVNGGELQPQVEQQKPIDKPIENYSTEQLKLNL